MSLLFISEVKMRLEINLKKKHKKSVFLVLVLFIYFS